MPIYDSATVPDRASEAVRTRGSPKAEDRGGAGGHKPLHVQRPSRARRRHRQDLPPATLVASGCDMLRDAGHKYARKVAATVNDITDMHDPDRPHGIIEMTMHSNACRQATTEVIAELRRRL